MLGLSWHQSSSWTEISIKSRAMLAQAKQVYYSCFRKGDFLFVYNQALDLENRTEFESTFKVICVRFLYVLQ